jgi:hypothetical protein
VVSQANTANNIPATKEVELVRIMLLVMMKTGVRVRLASGQGN